MRWPLAALFAAIPSISAAEPAATAEATGGILVGDEPAHATFGLRAGARLPRLALMFGVDGESVQTEGGDYERSETRLRMQAQLVVREPATAPTYLRFRFGVGAERAKVVETFSFLTTNMTTEVSYRPSTEAAVGLAHDVGNASIAAEIAVNEAGTSAARFNAVFLALVGVRL